MTKKKSSQNRGDTDREVHIEKTIQTTKGDLVGRDKTVHGDVIHGDKVAGDKVGRDKVVYGGVSNAVIATGRGAQATATVNSNASDIAELFANIYRQIEARPEDLDVDKEEISENVQKIQEEVGKGEQANPSKVERWLKALALMAPDILDVTIAALTSPATCIATVVRKVAKKAKDETRQAESI